MTIPISIGSVNIFYYIRMVLYEFFLKRIKILAGRSVYHVVEGYKIHAFIFRNSTCA